jgi:uncharacterized protein
MKKISVLLSVGTVMLIIMSAPAFAVPVNLFGGGGGEYNIPTKSMVEKRFTNVAKQKYDYSCGSAALSTLLREFYGIHADEGKVLQAMYDVGDQEAIKKKGFSLLDMRSYLASIGYTADGYRAPLDKLVKARIPAIALISPKGYSHFVVIAGVSPDSVLILDSSKGKHVLSRNEFEKQWNGILFIVHDDMKIARKSFNSKDKWASHLQARFNVNLNDRDLASASLATAYMPGYY